MRQCPLRREAYKKMAESFPLQAIPVTITMHQAGWIMCTCIKGFNQNLRKHSLLFGIYGYYHIVTRVLVALITLLQPEWPKLYGVFAILSVLGLNLLITTNLQRSQSILSPVLQKLVIVFVVLNRSVLSLPDISSSHRESSDITQNSYSEKINRI